MIPPIVVAKIIYVRFCLETVTYAILRIIYTCYFMINFSIFESTTKMIDLPGCESIEYFAEVRTYLSLIGLVMTTSS
jgi:hypothetical protein